MAVGSRRGLFGRVALLVAGWSLIVIGLVELVLPGPGIPLVLAGLAILATEYAWARHLLHATRERAHRWLERLRRRA